MPLDVILLILRVTTAIALYAFLGLMLIYIWRDVLSAAHQMPQRLRVSGKLVVVKSDDVPIDQGREFQLQPTTTLGRGPANTIVVPDSSASMEHAAITWRRGQWWLEDQQSRNGTMINNIPVTEPVVLASGDEIGIGRVRLRLEMES
jgi:hypothetical protein